MADLKVDEKAMITEGYSNRGDSNEYPQHIFLWRNKQNYPLIITKYLPYLFFCPHAAQDNKCKRNTMTTTKCNTMTTT